MPQNPNELKIARSIQLSVREALSSKKQESQKGTTDELSDPHADSEDDELSFDARMRQQILKKRMENDDIPTKQNLKIGMLFSVA